jgi:hypothetical protein
MALLFCPHNRIALKTGMGHEMCVVLRFKYKLSFQTLINIVAYLLKARTVEAEKQPLLGNVRMQQ